MRNFSPFIVLLLGLAVIFFTVTGRYGFLHMLELKSELHNLQATNDEIKRSIADYEANLAAIRFSSEVVEKQAREDLGYAKENEMIYVFPRRKVKDQYENSDLED